MRVVNPLGFHARAAARFVAEASRFESQVTVVFKDKEMDGKSILGLLLLAAPCGASIQVRAEGRDEKEAIKALAALVSSGFGEARENVKLSGFAIAPGRVLGRAFVFRRAERQVPFRHLEKAAARARTRAPSDRLPRRPE